MLHKRNLVKYLPHQQDKSAWSTACFTDTHSRCKGTGISPRSGVRCTCPCHKQ
ncbi:MAG: hypothetical protein HRU07_05905 [Nitrosopumilus sp.]|nr:hypothetical protein [Nitrosopumilus sp.]NRA05680.1 hypothetical protein [Nitrosopumilus sp.]